MVKMITLVKEGHEVHMPADWPALQQTLDEGYAIVEDKTTEQEPEKTTLDHVKENTTVKPGVDTADQRTTLEKMNSAPKAL